MGFRVQKSFRIAKGVRLNLSKTGIGLSVGVPGARYSVHSSGRRTTSLGVPGSGVRYQKTTRGGKRRSRSAPPLPTDAGRTVVHAKPGLFAPRGEKALHKAVVEGDADAIATAGERFPDYAVVAFAVAGFLKMNSDRAGAAVLLARALTNGLDPADHPFFRNYIGGSNVGVPIAHGVTALLPLNRDAVGLMLAELHQEAEELATAVDVVEQLEPSTFAAVSLAELYMLSGRPKDAIALTEDIRNEDDASALLCVFRGQALHDLGYHDAALVAYKEALKSKSRPNEIRHLALSERARTFEALGKRVMARKDLERILGEDWDYPGLKDRIEALAREQ
jgi:tetratricopeptide (TPR) repeat protein